MEERQVILAKVTQDTEVGAVFLGDVHEGQILTAPPFNFTGAENTMAVGVDQNGNDKPGVIGTLAKVVILLFNPGGIYVFEDVRKHKTVVILRE